MTAGGLSAAMADGSKLAGSVNGKAQAGAPHSSSAVKSKHLCSTCHAVVCNKAQHLCTPSFWMCDQQAALVNQRGRLQPAEGMTWQIPTMRTQQTPWWMGLGLTARP